MSTHRIINGRYKVMAEERAGGLVATLDAYDQLTTQPVVLSVVQKDKVPADYPLAAIRADMEHGRTLAHPDMLRCFDMFEDEATLTLVSEFSGLPPISALRPVETANQAANLVRAIQKLVYAVEFHHSNKLFGCVIRTPHIRLSPEGETRIDPLVATRLSYMAEGFSATGARVDMRLAGEAVQALLALIPLSADEPVLARILASVVPQLTRVAEGLMGSFGAIGEASSALAQVEDSLRACLSEAPRAFPIGSARRHFAAGELIFREGDPAGEEAFVIERGLVQISKSDPEGHEIPLDLSRPGDIVGEMALLDDSPRMANARAIEPCDLVVISGHEFRANVARMDNVGRRLVSVLAGRLRHQASEVARLKALIAVCK